MRTLAITILLLLLASVANAATFYIDITAGDDTRTSVQAQSKSTPWAHNPYMSDASDNADSYTASPGDVFVHKGGETWGDSSLPMTVNDSGDSDDQIILTVDETWYTGGSYSAPIFDGENDKTSYCINLNSTDYVTIDGLKIINMGVSGDVSGDVYCIYANPLGSGIVIQNNTIIGYCDHGINLYPAGSSSISPGPQIINNDMSILTNFIEIGATITRTGLTDQVLISGNSFHDPHLMMVSGDHVDGIHIFGFGDQYVITDLIIESNKWYGDWGSSDASTSATAQIYSEDAQPVNIYIYNNIMTYSNTSTLKEDYLFSPAMILTGGNSSSTTTIVNNTIDARAIDPGASAGASKGIQVNGDDNVVVKGNIIVAANIGIQITDDTGADCDYNIVYDCNYYGNNGSNRSTLSQWQNYSAFGDNSSESDPLITVPSSSDLSVSTGSPAIGLLPYAEASYTVFTDDIDSNERGTGAWDAGAYLFDSTPAFVSASINGSTASITFSEDLDDTAFANLVNGDLIFTGTTTGASDLESCSENAGVVSCTADATFVYGETVTLSSSGLTGDELCDGESNCIESISGQSVVNNTQAPPGAPGAPIFNTSGTPAIFSTSGTAPTFTNP